MSVSRDARLARILFVRALEESDRDGRFLEFRDRRRATRDARGAPDPLDTRAEILAGETWRRHPALRWGPRLAVGRVPVALTVVVGGAIGLAVDAAENQRHVSLLSFPLLGLIAWNLAIYAASTLRALGPRSFGTHGIERALVAIRPRRAVEAAGERDWIARALERFLEHWRAHLARLASLRVRAALHLAAAAAGLGIVLGLYVRGFAFEYRATWESTFLDAEGVGGMLSAILAPAAVLLGAVVPAPETIAALRAPADGPAALWIHLWGTTTMLAVVLPRLGLAAAALLRARRMTAALDLVPNDPYRLRVLAGGEGAVDWAPYAHDPSPAARERVREALAELYGGAVPITERPAVAYGEAGPPERTPESRFALVFNLAQSPEAEVHGELLEEISGEGGVALLDAEPFAGAVAAGGEERLAARLRAWARLCRGAGVAAIVVGPDGPRDLDLWDAPARNA